jgi:uncharacterized protein (DUF302 family)
MKKIIFLFFIPLFLYATNMNKNGIVTKISRYNVDKTIKVITNEAYKLGFTEFQIIDHKKNYYENYKKVINEDKLILFTKYTVCSRLLDFDPSVGLDLPLRILVYVGRDKKVHVKYRDPKFLKNIYNVGNLKETTLMSKKLDKITNLVKY